MKILITGISGFVGKNLAQAYQAQGNHVIGHIRDQDLSKLLDQSKPDLILHCAAEIYDPESMFESNLVMTWQCLDYARQHHCHMIYFGSSSEYGWRDCVTSESTVLEPHTAYAGTKAAGTMMCQGWAREFALDVQIMRLYSIYGPEEKPHRLFPKLWCAFRLMRPMRLVEGVHDFVYIDDAVDAVMRVASSPDRSPGEIINVCSGQQHTNGAVLDHFVRAVGRQAPVDFDPDQFVTQPLWQGDNGVLRKKYGWSPKYDLNTGIQTFLQRANYD